MNEKFFGYQRKLGTYDKWRIRGYLPRMAISIGSTDDDMVKAVDVSKGLWLHYFGSKAGLYTFVYGYSVKYMILDLSSAMDAQEKGLFRSGAPDGIFTKMRVSKVTHI